MARSNKPIVWGLFAAGGTLAAFVLPVLVLILLLAGHGQPAAALSYGNMHAFAAGWFGKLILFAVISLCLWHAAHRLRDALHGLGLRADKLAALIAYGAAAVGSVLSIHYLLQI